MNARRIAGILLFGLLASWLAGASARADEFHYVMIFGSQSKPKRLKYTHTWATLIKATGEGPDAANYALDVYTISWLPATLDVKVWSPRPEPGVNLDLDQTIRAMLANDESITMWGPFRVRPVLWERAQVIRGIIERNEASYRAISNSSNMLVSDCIHAIAAVDPDFGRNHYPLIRIGKPASRYIARQVMTRSQYDQTAEDHSWLIPRLGLCRRPIEVIPPRDIPKRNCFLCLLPDRRSTCGR